MLRIAVCDDDKVLLAALGREVELWAEAEGHVCSVELFATAESFLFA